MQSLTISILLLDFKIVKKRIKLDSLIRNLLNDLSVKKNDKFYFIQIYCIFQFNQKNLSKKI